MTELATDAVLVFVLGLLIALIRYAWIGYWRMHRGDFIELSNITSSDYRGNSIIVKTPPRKRRGKHLIIIEESVNEKGRRRDGEESGSETEEEEGEEEIEQEVVQVTELQSSPSYGDVLEQTPLPQSRQDSPTISLLSSRASGPPPLHPH